MKRAPGCLCGIALFLCAPLAYADQPSPQDLARAARYEQKAQDFDQMGDYPRAVENYRLSYELSGNPKLLFRLGELYRAMGQNDRALEAFQSYLAAAPEGPAAAAARQNIETIEAEQRALKAAQEALAKERARKQARRQIDSRKESEAPAADGESKSREAPAALVATPAEPSPDPGRIYKIAGLGTAGLGLALTGVGIYFGLSASSIKSELDAIAVWGPEENARFADWEAARRNAFIFAGVGVAALAGGGVLYYFGMRKDQQAEQMMVSATPTSGGAALQVWGRF